MKKIEPQENMSLYQMQELLRFIIRKLDLEVDEKKETIPDSIKRHFKNK